MKKGAVSCGTILGIFLLAQAPWDIRAMNTIDMDNERFSRDVQKQFDILVLEGLSELQKEKVSLWQVCDDIEPWLEAYNLDLTYAITQSAFVCFPLCKFLFRHLPPKEQIVVLGSLEQKFKDTILRELLTIKNQGFVQHDFWQKVLLWIGLSSLYEATSSSKINFNPKNYLLLKAAWLDAEIFKQLLDSPHFYYADKTLVLENLLKSYSYYTKTLDYTLQSMNNRLLPVAKPLLEWAHKNGSVDVICMVWANNSEQREKNLEQLCSKFKTLENSNELLRDRFIKNGALEAIQAQKNNQLALLCTKKKKSPRRFECNQH